jgi:hypothetical protein
MNTNPLGKGTRNISGNVSAETYLELEKLASVSGTSISAYLRALAEFAVRRQLLARENLAEKALWTDAVISGLTPLPKVRWEIRDLDEHTALAAKTPAPYGAVAPPPKKPLKGPPEQGAVFVLSKSKVKPL